MSNINPIFETILNQHGYGNGRKRITKTLRFASGEDKAAFLESSDWATFKYGYGAYIESQDETTLTYTTSNSCD